MRPFFMLVFFRNLTLFFFTFSYIIYKGIHPP